MNTNLQTINLIIASSNIGKVNEFKKLLYPYSFKVMAQPLDFKVDENGSDFKENARIKALAVSRETGFLSLADDSGLMVKALGGAPGVHSARYAKSDKERINRLLKEMEEEDERNASFIAALCVVSTDGKILIEVQGECKGLITRYPRGNNGFGYDPIFEVEGIKKTFAELDSKTKQIYGHRGQAFSLLRPFLDNYV